MVLYCWNRGVVNLPHSSNGYLRPSIGECIRICRMCVSRPFWWFDMTAIWIINVRIGRLRTSLIGICTQPVDCDNENVNKIDSIPKCIYMFSCLYLLVPSNQQFRFLVDHWSVCPNVSIFDLVYNFRPIYNRCICKFDWQTFCVEIEYSPSAAVGHPIANMCPYNCHAIVQRQILWWWAAKEWTESKCFQCNWFVLVNIIGRKQELPGLHDDKLHTACAPTSVTLPVYSSLIGSVSPPDFVLMFMVLFVILGLMQINR